jgi:Flp pilus assembly pilin Flp
MKTLSLLSTRMYCAAAAKRQKGATMIEYVLLAALIGVVVALALPALTTAITTAFGTIAGEIN